MNDKHQTGPQIIQFESVEAAMDFMETRRMEASEGALPEQWALADGKEHHYLSAGEGVIAMGRIPSTKEHIDIEQHYYDMENPDDVAEWNEFLAEIPARLKRGFIFSKQYSIITPEGEWGHRHVASCAPASKEAMDEFYAARFRLTHPALQPELAKVITNIIDKKDQQGKSR